MPTDLPPDYKPQSAPPENPDPASPPKPPGVDSPGLPGEKAPVGPDVADPGAIPAPAGLPTF